MLKKISDLIDEIKQNQRNLEELTQEKEAVENQKYNYDWKFPDFLKEKINYILDDYIKTVSDIKIKEIKDRIEFLYTLEANDTGIKMRCACGSEDYKLTGEQSIEGVQLYVEIKCNNCGEKHFIRKDVYDEIRAREEALK